INEALFGKDGQNFRLLIDKCIKIAKGQWLEEIEQSKKYEEFAGFTNLRKELKKKEEIIRDKNESIEDLKVKLSGAYSSDKIEGLTRFRDLKKELEEGKKQIEDLKEKAQPEIKLLKKTIEDKDKSIEELRESIAKLQSSEEVEKLGRVKELK